MVVQIVTASFWGFVAVGVLARVVMGFRPGGRRVRSGAGGPVVGAGAVESELYGFPTRILPAPEPRPTSYGLVVDTPRDRLRDVSTPEGGAR